MKKRMSKLLSLFCAAVLVMGVFAGCSTQKKLQKVTVSEVTHSVFYAPQYAAIELGFFEEEGLEIDLVNAQGGRFEIDIDGDLFKSVVEFNLID